MKPLYHLAVIVVAALVYGAFTWGVFAHFRRPLFLPMLLRIAAVAATTLTIVQVARIWRIDPGWWAVPALAGYAGAAALYGWALAATRQRPPSLIFSDESPTDLVAHGPYRYVRHPFYTAYLLYWLAGAVAIREWWLVPALALAAASFVLAALGEERQFERGDAPEAYRTYRRSTGMFLPRFVRPP